MPATEFDLRHTALEIRRTILRMISTTKNSHLGSCYSITDILTVLYFRILRMAAPTAPDRDIFILSKGHAAVALYATLAQKEFFPRALLETYGQDGSTLAGHVIRECLPGVEATAGSLGHGLPIANGLALANRHNDRRFFVVLGDGECNEGSVWEAANFAAHHKLNHLTAIIDCNQLQGVGFTKDVLAMENMAERWRAFNWHVIEIDGHNLAEIEQAFQAAAADTDRPTAIIAHTVKGKGVSWMENNNEWHYKPPTPEQMAAALTELV